MRRTALLCLLLLTLAACGGSTGVDVGDGGDGALDGRTPDDGGGASAAGPFGAWELRDSSPAVEAPEGVRTTLRVEQVDGEVRVGGDTACNGYGGVLELDAASAGSWAIRELAVTEMGCEPERSTAQQVYLDALGGVDAWSRPSADTLVLTGGDAELVFALLPPVEAAALVGTDWRLTGFVDGDAVSQHAWDVEDARLRLDGDAEGGTFTLFSGCRDFDGEWVAGGDTIRWPTWGQSEGSREADACTEAELESEALVLAAVEGGFTVELGEGSLLLRSAADATVGLQFTTATEDG